MGSAAAQTDAEKAGAGNETGVDELASGPESARVEPGVASLEVAQAANKEHNSNEAISRNTEPPRQVLLVGEPVRKPSSARPG